MLSIGAPFALAAKVNDQRLGDVVTVRRTFAVDLSDCRKNWSASPTGTEANCYVRLVKRAGEEGATTDRDLSEVGVADDVFRAGIYVTLAGYQLRVSPLQWKEQSAPISFEAARPLLDQLLKKVAPNGQVHTFVHTTRIP